MKAFTIRSLIGLCLLAPVAAQADDIDIFLNPPQGGANNPNILFVLDNSANWSRNDQKFPEMKQGEAEILAIKETIQALDDRFNVGLLMYNYPGGGSSNTGFVRYHIRPMTDANKTIFSAALDDTFNNFNNRTGPANVSYGGLMHEVHNYLSSGESLTPGSVPAEADEDAYSSPFTQYQSPLTADNNCAETIIILIGNPGPQGPQDDLTRDSEALEKFGGDRSDIDWPEFATTSDTIDTLLGTTASKYKAEECPASTEFAADCANFDSCSCVEVAGTCQGKNKNRQCQYEVYGQDVEFSVTPTGTYSPPPSSDGYIDRWARFFHTKGIETPDGNRRARTYTIDVFNLKQHPDDTRLLLSTARVGGGKYYAAKSRQDIINAILDIFSDIQAVNSTFASASLPISATNRAQNENQVFIGMFRPDPKAFPRWFGNLKRYQLIGGESIRLGDVNGNPAVNTVTGFVSECAQSFFTFDSNGYWGNISIEPSPAGSCLATENDPFSDAPDGPQVEKGAVAQAIRAGNNPPTTTSTPTYAVNRNVLTLAGNTLTAITVGNTGLDVELVKFLQGEDRLDEDADGNLNETRPSIHGDVIHSRPLPVNYGEGDGVVVFYGSNDGTLRAVSGNTGKELWAFIAPEFTDRLARLKDNAPKIAYPGIEDALATRKTYFFDGSLGLLQNEDNSVVNIYAAMRRGGRQIYAFDVADPDTPAFKWKIGCPNLGDETNCPADWHNIGQTWSTPTAAPVALPGDASKTVVMFGGGYDLCEDADNKTPSCGSAKGRAVYIVDADTGAKLKEFPTDRGVVADIALIDMNADAKADFGYTADMGGNVYRINFRDADGPLPITDWSMTTVASTAASNGRKFQFAPALVQSGGNTVFVALGSGDREHPLISQYPTKEPVTNRFYVFADKVNAATALDLDDTSVMHDYSSVTDCDAEQIGTSVGSKAGWFMDLKGSGADVGEQTVTSAIIIGGQVAFSTNRPVEPDPLSCGSNLGEARGYLVNLLNASGSIGSDDICGGERSGIFEGGGLPPSPVVARVPVDGQLETVVIGVIQPDPEVPSSPIEAGKPKLSIDSRRNPLYWLKSSGID